MKMTRRDVFSVAASAAWLSQVTGRHALAADAKPGLMIQSVRPADYEMTLAGFRDWITPMEHFFVRSHHYTPSVQINDWSLKIEGLVGSPATLKLDDLKKLPRVSYVAVLECAGNGRAFYEPHIPGMQWKYGGVGNARWSGVRLADVLKNAGIKDSAKEILFDGEDVPIGTMPKFQRTVPVAKALHPDTMLAFEMNGQPITMDHGFPLRLIVPGWAGDSWVKWVKRIDVLDHDFEGFFMKTAYRHPTKPVAPGTAVPPAEMTPVTDINVKSVIASPAGNWAAPGLVKISGAAWSNGSEIAAVDVSTDGGKTWKPAHLGKDKSKYAWRLWNLNWKAPEGKYSILARAKDAAGNVQPMEQQWNPSGYSWNVSAPQELVVSHSEQGPIVATAMPVGDHPPGYKTACLTCHEEDLMRMQKLNPAQWDREVQKMVGWGAEIKPENKDAILSYLKANFKP